MAHTETVRYAIPKHEFARRFHAQVREDGLGAHVREVDNPWFGTYADGAFRLYRQEAKLSGCFPMVLKGQVEAQDGGISIDLEYRQLPIRGAALPVILLFWVYTLVTGNEYLLPVAAAVTIMLAVFAVLINPAKRREALRQKLDELCAAEQDRVRGCETDPDA